MKIVHNNIEEKNRMRSPLISKDDVQKNRTPQLSRVKTQLDIIMEPYAESDLANYRKKFEVKRAPQMNKTLQDELEEMNGMIETLMKKRIDDIDRYKVPRTITQSQVLSKKLKMDLLK